MADSDEAILASIMVMLAKNQKFIKDTQDAILELTKGISKRKPDVINIQASEDILKALEKNALQIEKTLKIMAAKPMVQEWHFEVDRDTSGFIRSVDASPKKVLN